MTFDDVIEEHRQALGASSVHVSLGLEATPESLRAVLAELNAKGEIYGSFSDAERRAAEVHRLRGLIDEISKTAANSDLAPEARLRQILDMTDMIPDVDLELDIEFMTKARQN